MKPSYRITIPEPCHENWHEMTPTQQGRFCKNCTKEVIDFTAESDEFLFKRITNGEHLCGRFRKDQINKSLSLKRANTFNLKAWLAGLVMPIALFFSKESYAQGEPVKVEQVPQTAKFKTSLGIGVQHRKLIEEPARELSGTVYSFDGKPLKHVRIINVDGKTSGLTDENGQFTILVNNGDLIQYHTFTYELKSRIVSIRDKTLDLHFKIDDYQSLVLGFVIPIDESKADTKNN